MPSPLSWWRDACAAVIGNGPFGTGFFVQSADDPAPYLVTCKHLIADTPAARAALNTIDLLASRLVNGQSVSTMRTVPLKDGNGNVLWREHPDSDIDVFVLRVSGIDLVGLDVHPVPRTIFPTPAQMGATEIEAGDLIVVLGYPGGRTQFPSARPVYRGATLGTPVIGHLRVQTPNGYAVIPAFWVDGMMVPGNSGSPVLLRPERIRTDNQAATPYSAPPYLLGMVVGCEYAQIAEVPAADAVQQDPDEAEAKKVYAGLAIAVNMDTIQDTLALF